MTPTQIIYAVAISILVFLFGWMVTPTLDRLRDSMRERAANAPLTPDTEAGMLKQLRMQQASLKRLEQFRANPRGIVLYILGLLAAAMFMFAVTVCMYPFVVQRVLLAMPATMSLLFFLLTMLEARNLTDERLENSITKLKKTIEDGKTKLKLLE